MATHFVPTEEIQKLTTGSYEFLASKLDETLSREAKAVFGESVPNKIERIGTFENYVLVAADDGRFAKVKYERSLNGQLKLMGAEPLSLSVYTESTLGGYLKQEALGIVDSLLAHDSAQAELKLLAMVPLVEERLAPTPEQTIASLIENIEADRPWKRLYRERTEQVRSFLGEELKGIEGRKLPIKFSKLVADSDVEAHKALVLTDLAYMAEALGGWLKKLDAAGDLKDLRAQPVDSADQGVVTTFLAFTEDLRQDLQSVREAVLASLQFVDSTPSLGGKLYDVLAEESFHYEVACRFAEMMVAGLRSPK